MQKEKQGPQTEGSPTEDNWVFMGEGLTTTEAHAMIRSLGRKGISYGIQETGDTLIPGTDKTMPTYTVDAFPQKGQSVHEE